MKKFATENCYVKNFKIGDFFIDHNMQYNLIGYIRTSKIKTYNNIMKYNVRS